jgi:galactonate dehydratase
LWYSAAPTAIRIGHALEEFDPWFIEEPIGSEDLGALRLIADNLRAPVASGERLVTRYAFKPMIDGHACDLLQIDPGRAGGSSSPVSWRMWPKSPACR